MLHPGCQTPHVFHYGPCWLPHQVLAPLHSVIHLLNVLVNANGAIPQTLVTGEATDISAFLTFHFWQEVFYQDPDKSEKLGHCVGVAPSHGDALTYLILSHDTEHVLVRSNVCPAKDPLFPNQHAHPDNAPPYTAGGEASSKPILSSLNDALGLDPSAMDVPWFSPEELLGLTFLHETESGEKIRAKIVCKILDRDAENPSEH